LQKSAASGVGFRTLCAGQEEKLKMEFESHGYR
jgi:hypothetical protein